MRGRYTITNRWGALRFRTTKNREVSTGPLARYAHSFGCSAVLALLVYMWKGDLLDGSASGRSESEPCWAKRKEKSAEGGKKLGTLGKIARENIRKKRKETRKSSEGCARAKFLVSIKSKDIC